MWKKRNASSSTWNMARKLKSMENEKYTLYEVKYWQESLKNVKNEKYTLCRTRSKARKMKIKENEKNTL